MRILLSTLLTTLFLATALTAQTTPVANQTTITTGMLGLTSSQTARLNVLNLSAVPVLTPVANSTPVAGTCSVVLEFYDGQDKLLNTLPPTLTVAPMTAIYQDLSGASIPSPSASPVASRHEIRGVVAARPATAATGASTAVVTPCTLKVTLEIFDNMGSTVALTSDTTTLPAVQVTPTVK